MKYWSNVCSFPILFPNTVNDASAPSPPSLTPGSIILPLHSWKSLLGELLFFPSFFFPSILSLLSARQAHCISLSFGLTELPVPLLFWFFLLLRSCCFLSLKYLPSPSYVPPCTWVTCLQEDVPASAPGEILLHFPSSLTSIEEVQILLWVIDCFSFSFYYKQCESTEQGPYQLSSPWSPRNLACYPEHVRYFYFLNEFSLLVSSYLILTDVPSTI